MTAQEAYLLARAYTDKVAEGGGAAKGAACQIKSITAITGGHRITFEWEDNAGNVETDTMDVMDGADGAAGVGISTITYKETDAQGNYIYTITLTSGSTYDITCPKGPQGAPGADGQDGSDGVGITSITKTGTSGLVDTYTITYTNGTTSTFTVTNGSNADLTAGQYIEINNDTISVKRDISKPAQEIEYNYTIPGDFTLRVKKYVNSDLVDTTDYQWSGVVDPINLDSIMEVSKKTGFYWVVKNLIASTTQAAEYSVDLYAMQQATNYTQTFITTIDADKKLIIQSELDAAINAIKDGQTIDSFADVETALAGKQATLTFDDVPTDNSNNPVKSDGIYDALATKADLTDLAPAFSAASAYAVGKYVSYEGNIYKCTSAHSAGAWVAGDFTLVAVGSELESKQDKTDNNLTTTDKTTTGAINELKSGLTNLAFKIVGIYGTSNATQNLVLHFSGTGYKRHSHYLLLMCGQASIGTMVQLAFAGSGALTPSTIDGFLTSDLTGTAVSVSGNDVIIDCAVGAGWGNVVLYDIINASDEDITVTSELVNK